MQVFCDLDGVLADFDTGHELVFGIRPCKQTDNVNWDAIRTTRNFYRDLPPMGDFHILWDRIRQYNPIILTGVPHSIEEAESNKREWVTKHLGAHVRMIGLPSSQKFQAMTGPGDILIDDWEKYRHVWERNKGRWITHVNAPRTIEQLKAWGL